MKSIFSFILLISVLALTAKEPVATLPFKVHRGHIYFQGEVNGKKANFLFDTGAPITVVNESFIDDNFRESKTNIVGIGVNGLAMLNLIKKNTFLIDQISIKRQHIYVTDLSPLQDFDLPVDIIIGGSLLEEYVVDIDFDESVIRLFKHKDFEVDPEYRVTDLMFFSKKFLKPYTRASFKVKTPEVIKGVFILDTGFTGTVSLNTPTVLENNLLDRIDSFYTKKSRGLNAENDTVDYIAKISEVEVFGHKFEDVPSGFSTVKNGVSGRSSTNGLIGLELLKKFNLVFNYKDKKLYFKKNSHYENEFVKNRHGLTVNKEDGYFQVLHVSPKSPADQAQILEGDHIISIDGKSNMTHDQFFKYFQNRTKEVELIIRRGNEGKVVLIRPQDMI